MNRDDFVNQMDNILAGNVEPIIYEEQINVIRDSIKKLDEREKDPFSGFYNIIIVIEELSELTKELTKALRDKGSVVGIVEELADVSLGIDYIKEVFDITDKELEYARSIKIAELKKKLFLGDFS